MTIVDGGLSVKIPKLIKIRQKFPKLNYVNLEEEICLQLDKPYILERIKPGMSIGVGVGSRGITKIDEIVKVLVNKIKSFGGNPIIIPAMGSQGGATVKGQIEILRALGINESSINAPIKSTMDVIKISDSFSGCPIYFNKMAYSLDGIIPVNRVKWHTDFVGEIESGLVKMLAVGFANQRGANFIHSLGYGCFNHIIPEISKVIIAKAPILFGVACIEDAYRNISEIRTIHPNNFFDEEKIMLKKAKKIRAKLNFKNIDVLIVDEIGKDISGTGADPKIIGRFHQREKVRKNDLAAPKVKQIVFLNLTEKSLGNASGVGYADIISKTLFNKIDFLSTYANVCVGHIGYKGDNFYEVKIPIMMENDIKAIKLALQLSQKSNTGQTNPKVARIKNTNNLEFVEISEELLDSVAYKKSFDIYGTYREIEFNKKGIIQESQ